MRRNGKILIRIVIIGIFITGIVTKLNDTFESVAVFGTGSGVLISRDWDSGIPLFLQSDERWGQLEYGNNVMEINGCGPTCLSMVWCGLTGETRWNPYEVAKMAEKEGYYVEGVGSSWELMTLGAAEIGLLGEEVVFDEYHIKNALEQGQPVICAMGPGDFTTEGHFIVLVGLTEDGRVIVNDPNSSERSQMSWDVETLMGQIKNLWAYSLK